MNWIAENPLAICMIGAVALAMALFVYFQTRTNGSLYGVLGVILLTAILVLVSWLIETPREAVERSLYSLAATVEDNDMQGTLNYLAPTADPQIRKDIETLMPLVKIERARIISTPEIEVGNGTNPKVATVKCQGVAMAVNRRDGMKGAAQDRFVMKWVYSRQPLAHRELHLGQKLAARGGRSLERWKTFGCVVAELARVRQ